MFDGIASGAVLRERPYKGIVTPTSLVDRSRWKNNGTHTDITMVQLPSGLWRRSYNGATSTIDCGTNDVLNLTGDLTLLVWMNLTSFLDDAGSGSRVLSRRSANNGYELNVYKQAGVRYVTFVANNTNYISTADKFNIGAWHLIACARISGSLTHNIDGVPLNSQAVPVLNSNAGDTLYVGKTTFAGGLALAKICNRALTPAQIRRIFTKEAPYFGIKV